jgi:hypothetical protein
VAYLQKDPSCNEEEARGLVQQVQEKDYNPPRRDTLLEYQQKQDFPILPASDDPDAGKVFYRGGCLSPLSRLFVLSEKL